MKLPLLCAAATLCLPALASAAPASPGAVEATTPAPAALSAPTRTRSWAAHVDRTVVVRAYPDRTGRVIRTLSPLAPLGSGPVWLLVKEVRTVAGERWVRVLLPVRPNGRTGWVRADLLTFRATAWRVRVDVSDRTLTLTRAGRVVRRLPVAVGAPGTPTPTGRFAVAEIVPTGNPRDFLGPTVLPLTVFSPVLNEYAGGNGRVAIHGTSVPSSIGRAASNGCIRMANADIGFVAHRARPGTIVDITP